MLDNEIFGPELDQFVEKLALELPAGAWCRCGYTAEDLNIEVCWNCLKTVIKTVQAIQDLGYTIVRSS